MALVQARCHLHLDWQTTPLETNTAWRDWVAKHHRHVAEALSALNPSHVHGVSFADAHFAELISPAMHVAAELTLGVEATLLRFDYPGCKNVGCAPTQVFCRSSSTDIGPEVDWGSASGCANSSGASEASMKTYNCSQC